MSFTWNTMGMKDHRVQEVEIYDTLEEVLEAMCQSAWEDDSNQLVDWITDENKVVAVAIFERASLDYLVTCSDGRVLRFAMPERYRE
jgi:hypothetical protein